MVEAVIGTTKSESLFRRAQTITAARKLSMQLPSSALAIQAISVLSEFLKRILCKIFVREPGFEGVIFKNQSG